MLMNESQYLSIVESIKSEIGNAQYKAAVSVNRELVLLYYNIGCIINEHKTWGNKFIENLAKDIKLEFPNFTGYSVRNLKYMSKFAAEYTDKEFVQQAVAQLPWGHNVVLLDIVSDAEQRKWHIKKCGENASGVKPQSTDWMSINSGIPQELYNYNYTVRNGEENGLIEKYGYSRL